MKGFSYSIVFCFLISSFGLAQLQNNAQQVKTNYSIQQKIKKVKIEVKEMTCQKGCADGIDKKLKGVNGIIRSKTKLETGISTVTYDESKISPNEIIKIIVAHGYPASFVRS